MRILAMVKQVRDPESPFHLEDGRIVLGPSPNYKMNSYDEYALETALRLAEQTGGRVTAVTVGPEEAKAVLLRAVGMGAGQGVHLLWEEDTPLRPSNIAALAAGFARDRDFDLVLAGVMSEDARQSAVGPMLAEMLDLPFAAGAVEVDYDPEARRLQTTRELEGGRRQRILLPLPALVTVQSGIHRPRYPSLSNMMRAKKTPPRTIPVSSPAAGPVREQCIGLYPPVKTRAGLVLEGSTEDKALELLTIFRERALL